MIHGLLPRGQPLQPPGRLVVIRRQRDHRPQPQRFPSPTPGLEDVQHPGEPARRLGQQPPDLTRQRSCRLKQVPRPGGLGGERVVDQQHDPLVGVFLQGGGQQGIPDDPLVFGVGRDDRGQRRGGRVVELVQDRPAGPVMGPGPVEEPQPAQQVRQRRHRQHRHDEQVEHRLGPVDRRLIPRMKEVREEPPDQVRNPGRHRHDDRQPRHRHPAVADRRRHHRQRPRPPVGTPLPTPLTRWGDEPRMVARPAATGGSSVPVVEQERIELERIRANRGHCCFPPV